MAREDINQLESMIEIVARAIPKENASAKLYVKSAKSARREMVRILFSKLAREAEEHETKLRATLDILQKELAKARKSPSTAEEGETCQPSHEFNVNIRRALRVAREMDELGEDGLESANDPSCQQMYQTILDYSKDVRRLAQEEIEAHIVKDKWD